MSPGLPFDLLNTELFRNKSYVNGDWVEAKSGARFNVIDPGSGRAWASCPDNSAEDVDRAVESAHIAFKSYKKLTPRARAQLLMRWDTLIKENKEDLARIVTYETGKPISESLAEIDYATGFTWWFSGEADRIQGSVQTPSAGSRRVLTIKQPIGVSAALIPWNFPIAMLLRKASAALAAGCTMIVKPSPETPISCLTLAYLAQKAGFAPGVFSVLTTSLENTPSLSEKICRHELVKKVSFTGSTRVGKLVAKMCADTLTKLTLELGGNCPFLIFDDANLQQALDALFLLKWRHAGQACITANRVYVQAGVYDRFAEMFAEKTKTLSMGHGADPATTIGPLTTERSLRKASQQVEDAKQWGGRIVTGGQQVHGKEGYFFEPTIILDATREMLITREETFAPVVALYKFETEEEAVDMANDTSMGLASYYFTKNVDRVFRLMENLEAGMIGSNTGNSSAAESPFGGIKESGYGKESGKDVAVNEYLITKTVTLSLEGHY